MKKSSPLTFLKQFSFFTFPAGILLCHFFCISDKSGTGTLAPGDTVTVLSYNVENLFDLQDNGTEYPEYKPFTHNWNNETQAKKLDNIASVCAAAQAEILALVEIENITAARQLQKALRRKQRHYPYITVGDQPNPTTTCQAILSRFPIVHTQGHGIPKQGKYYTRNILEADIALGKHTLKIFAVHWPSKRFSESYRIAAAKVLLKRLQQLAAGTEYIITGDFNSNYNEAETFFTERLDDTEGKTAINHILKTARSSPGSFIDYIFEQEPAASKNSLYHYDLWLELPEHRRFNYVYHGQNNTLDHILLPGTMYDSDGISYVDNSFAVFTWQGRLLYDGVPYRWKKIYSKKGKYHTGEGYSDHLPVSARFVINPFSFADTPVKKTNPSPTDPGVVGFETGCEGWLPSSNRFRVTRDTINTAAGGYCLKVEGLAKKGSNAAYCRLPLQQINTRQQASLRLDIRGNGRFALRLRIDFEPWLCYTGNNFSRKIRSTRYTTFSSPEWQTVRLPLPLIAPEAKALELQIRAAGEKELCVWIDQIGIE